MARANRYYVPGLIWHVTHRCHKKEFFSRDRHFREANWPESVAVGTKSFVEKIKERLGIKALGRQVVNTANVYELKEPVGSYRSIFDSLTAAFERSVRSSRMNFAGLQAVTAKPDHFQRFILENSFSVV